MLENIFPYITLIVAIIGWFVTFWLTRSKDLELREFDKRIAHIRSQIDDFYGPIHGLRQQCKFAHQAYVKLMPKDENNNIDISKLTATHRIYHDFITETYLMPINGEIAKIIRSKIHLLNSQELPESYNKFLEHQVQFECYYRFLKENGLNTYDIIGTKFPEDFDVEIIDTLQKLRRDYKNKINKDLTGFLMRK